MLIDLGQVCKSSIAYPFSKKVWSRPPRSRDSAKVSCVD